MGGGVYTTWAAECESAGGGRQWERRVAGSTPNAHAIYISNQTPLGPRHTSLLFAAPDHNIPTTFAQTIPLFGPTDIIRYVVGRRSFFPDAVLGRCATIYPHLALSQCAFTRTLSPSPALAFSRLATDSPDSPSPFSSIHFPHTQTHTHTVHAHK